MPAYEGFGGIRVRFTPISARSFRKLNPNAMTDVRTIIVRDFIPALDSELRIYPPETRKYRGYKRTGKLKRAWKVKSLDTGDRLSVDARNDVQDRGRRYAGPVMGTNQWGLFSGIGWRRAVDIRDTLLRKMRIRERIQAALTFRGT